MSMRHLVPIRAPFSFAQSLRFIERFPPNRTEYVIEPDAVTAAMTVDGRAVPVTVRAVKASAKAKDAELEVTAPDDVRAADIVPRVAAWLGTEHDLAPFYAIAECDEPFAPIVRSLHGLHHVAFASLAEIAVYCVMMQRAPITIASGMKRRFLDRFGLRVQVGARELRAMPALDTLAKLDGDDIAEAINHRVKGPKIAVVVRGVAQLGETFLREAPYEEARDALLEIPGIGPFSAAAILLRGLGRMDALPAGVADEEGRAVYGRAYSANAIAKRYGTQIGYWSFYVKTGVARMST